MLDHQRIIDDVRASLYSTSHDAVDFARAAAADYLVACEQANERLRKCGNLLRQGLRSEAIHLSEIEPNLLDLVAVLDFPERPQWEQSIARYGIIAPPPLLLDVAADLNEAYALEQPLATLLARHRLMALAQSPLKLRITTLRDIAETDVGNPVWSEDLITFQRERLKQIHSEIAIANKAADIEALEKLYEELVDGQWIETPSKSLQERTARSIELIKRNNARSELEQLVVQLSDAFAALDLATSRRLRDHWEACRVVCPLPEDDSLLQRAEPVLTWIAEQDEIERRLAEHRASVSALERALDYDTDQAEVERLYKAATQHNYEVPEAVENLYRKHVRSLALRATRRTRLITLLAAAAILVLAALVALGARQHFYRSEVAEKSQTLKALIDETKIDEAITLIDQLRETSPRVARSAEIEAQIARLTGLLELERQRAQAFQQYFEQATRRGAENPDRSALVEAKSLATTEEEKASVFDFERKVSEVDAKHTAAANEVFAKGLDDLIGRIAALDDLSATEQRAAAVERIAAELTALDQRSLKATALVRAQGKSLWSKIDALRANLQREGGQEKQLDDLTSAVGDIAGFEKALRNYIAANPNLPRSADFKRVLDEAPLWKAVTARNEAAAQLNSLDISTLDPKSAAAELLRIKPLLEESTSLGSERLIEERILNLQAIAARIDPSGAALQEKLRLLFSDNLVAGLWTIRFPDGRTYYTLEEVQPVNAALKGYKYLARFDFAEKTIVVRPDDKVHMGPSPQSKLSKDVQRLLATLEHPNWEATFNRILLRIQTDEAVDPLLKINLLYQTTEVALHGSRPLQIVIGEHLKVLKEHADPFANWLDPEDAGGQKNRRLAAEVLNTLPDLSKLEDVIGDEIRSVRANSIPVLPWVGWLHRRSQGEWECRGDLEPYTGGILMVVLPTADNAGKFVSVGSVDSKSVTITPAEVARLAGRPIFLRPSKN